MTLCEEKCDLIEYDSKKEKVKCSCDIKLSIPLDHNIKFNKNEFFKSFTDVENIFNIDVVKCYKVVFKIKSLIKNYGFFIAGSVFIIYIITLIIFNNISYKKIKNEIYEIMYAIKHLGNPIRKKKLKKKKQKGKKNNNNNKYIEKNDLKIYDCNIDEKNLNKIDNEKNKNNKEQFDKYIENSLYKIYLKNNFNSDENKQNIYKTLFKEDFELNSLDYEEAIKLDQRIYCQYYLSLLKYNHPILFSFGFYNDYNSKIIKIFLFFFFLCFDLSINALFFTDDTMHKIYQDKGKFNFLYQIPQILYSTLISRFIDSIIKKFALSQDDIIELKQVKLKDDLEIKCQKLLRTLKIKFIIFFVLSFIILISLWYYITCFCGIYVNTQIHLFKDSLISLITSLLLPFCLCLIPGILRVSSLRKTNKKLLYKFSIYIENWIC